MESADAQRSTLSVRLMCARVYTNTCGMVSGKAFPVYLLRRGKSIIGAKFVAVGTQPAGTQDA
jgi:hypothetical protein